MQNSGQYLQYIFSISTSHILLKLAAKTGGTHVGTLFSCKKLKYILLAVAAMYACSVVQCVDIVLNKYQ